MHCPDCRGELELQEDGDVVRGAWQYDHTDAICTDCDATFRIDKNGQISRADGPLPVDEMMIHRQGHGEWCAGRTMRSR